MSKIPEESNTLSSLMVNMVYRPGCSTLCSVQYMASVSVDLLSPGDIFTNNAGQRSSYVYNVSSEVQIFPRFPLHSSHYGAHFRITLFIFLWKWDFRVCTTNSSFLSVLQILISLLLVFKQEGLPEKMNRISLLTY